MSSHPRWPYMKPKPHGEATGRCFGPSLRVTPSLTPGSGERNSPDDSSPRHLETPRLLRLLSGLRPGTRGPGPHPCHRTARLTKRCYLLCCNRQPGHLLTRTAGGVVWTGAGPSVGPGCRAAVLQRADCPPCRFTGPSVSSAKPCVRTIL